MKLTKQQKLLALEADLKLHLRTGYFFIVLLGVAGLAGLIWIFEAHRVW
jgi:hypothetical protein